MNKRPLGVIILSVLGALMGILVFWAIGPEDGIRDFLIGIIIGGSFIVLHVGLFMLAKWARSIILIFSFISASIGLPSLFLFVIGFVLMFWWEFAGKVSMFAYWGSFFFGLPGLLGLAEILYLKRPKVKELFN